MKKKINSLSFLVLSSLVLLSLALTSCESMDYYTVEKNSSSRWRKENHLVRLVAELRSLELDSNAIWWKDVPQKPSSSKRYSVDSFYAAPIMQNLDNSLGFTKKLPEDRQIQLMQVLCNNLPLYEEEPDLRLVAVGNYYGRGRHLVILVTKYTLQENSVPGVKKGILFLTNAYKPELNPARKDSGTSFDTKYNSYVTAIPFSEGRCVLSRNLNLGKYSKTDSMTPSQKADLMDIYCLDENSENDYDVIALYREVMVDSESTRFDRACASLNYGLMFFKFNDVEAAEGQWGSVSTRGLSSAERAWIELFLGRDRSLYYTVKQALN